MKNTYIGGWDEMSLRNPNADMRSIDHIVTAFNRANDISSLETLRYFEEKNLINPETAKRYRTYCRL